jgi:serine/threonine protein kinase/WD40 repeat protein
MSAQRYRSEISVQREIFLGALERLDPSERAAFLDDACGTDAELRRRVKDLLREEASVGSFLEQPVWNAAKSTGSLPIEKSPKYIGPYKLIEKLGEGGCGIVYLARQEKPLRREVALKVIKLGMDTRQVIARFETERQTLALMDHPHIAKVLDAGTTEAGRPFFVMELVRGLKLTDYCDQNRLTIQERLRLFIQVCQGIQHAHQKGIIHRDIKPSNILVASLDGKAVPKIIDFGIARAIRRTHGDSQTVVTGVGQLLGTPTFMSPEQMTLSGLDIDTRSDIYSLGALFYELLTGRTPFDHACLRDQDLEECRKIIRYQDPPRPSTRLSSLTKPELSQAAQHRRSEPDQLVKALRGDLDWIIMKALEKDRARRYPSAISLAQDVENYLANEPVLARPPTNLYRLQKLVHRNRPVFAAVMGMALVLIIATAVSTWLAILAIRAETQTRLTQKMETQLRQQAERERERATAQAELARQNEYVADIDLAQQSLISGNYGRAVQLLQKHLPRKGEPDLRGFEWRYLWQVSRGENHLQFSNQDGPVRTLAISHTGRWLASGTGSKLNLWDLHTEALVRSFPIREVSTVFGPNDQDLIVATPLGVRTIDLSTGQETNLLNQDGGVLAMSKDGSRLATTSHDGVRLWDTKTWHYLTTLPGASAPIAFSPDGTFLAANGRFGVSLWELTNSTVQLVLKNSQRLFRSGVSDQLGAVMTFTLDGLYLVAPRNRSSQQSTFALGMWDVRTGEEVGTLPQDPEHVEHTGFISGLALSPDGGTLASASMDHSIRLWDVRSRNILGVLHGHLSEVWTLGFTPDGRTLISGAKDGAMNFWPIPPKPAKDLLEGPYSLVAYSHDGHTLAVLDQRRGVVLFLDSVTRETKSEFTLNRGPLRGPRPFALSSDLEVLAEGLGDGTARLYNLATKKTVDLQASDSPMVELTLSPDGRQLITSEWGQPPRWWDVGARTNIVFGNHWRRLLFSPDGNTLLAVTDVDRAELWDTASRSLRSVLHSDFPLGPAAAFSPDSRLAAIAADSLSPDQMVNIWDTANGRSLGTCVGHKQGIHSLAFSADGKALASTSDDRTLKLWSVSTLQQLLSFEMSGAVNHPLFSPDGKVLVVDQAPPQRGIRFYPAPQPEDIEFAVRGRTIP